MTAPRPAVGMALYGYALENIGQHRAGGFIIGADMGMRLALLDPALARRAIAAIEGEAGTGDLDTSGPTEALKQALIGALAS